MCPEIILPGNGIILLSLVSETVRYSFLTAYGITKRIILIMIEYSVRDFVLCGCSVLLILASDDTAYAALLIAYIMVIRLGILAVGADQSQSTDIADDVAAVVLLCYDFPVFIIEELLTCHFTILMGHEHF